MTTTMPTPRPAGPGVASRVHGRASLDRADRDDAKRGHPAVDLTPYARSRDLQYLGSQNASGYFAALPLEPELQFNVVRGTVGSRDVCLWHWRYPWPVDDDGDLAGGGTFWGVVVTPPMSRLWSAPRRFVSTTEADEIFAGVPCTGAAALVPEAVLLPDFTIDDRPAGLFRRPSLAGLPGYDLRSRSPLPDGLLETLVAGPFGEILRAGSRFPLFEVAYRHGTLVLRRNGYAATGAELDELLAMARDAGDALAAACRPLHRPQPFDQPLPAADWPRSEPGAGRPWPPSPLLESVHALARSRGLALEDPRAYAAAFPTNPVPGDPWAVLRGSLPGLPATARLALHSEAPLARSISGRTALLLPAGDARPTPPGGVAVTSPSDPMRYAVRDGVFAVWVLRWQALSLGDIGGLLTRGAALARETGALR
jgi:hypothetical protein